MHEPLTVWDVILTTVLTTYVIYTIGLLWFMTQRSTWVNGSGAMRVFICLTIWLWPLMVISASMRRWREREARR